MDVFEISYRDVILYIEGTFYPEEAAVMYDDNLSGHPGTAAKFDIDSIKCCEQNIIELLHYNVIEEIEILILNTYYNYNY